LLSTLRAGFAYEGAARAAVVALKFRSGRHLAPLMGELLRHELERRPLRAEIVVPVPLAHSRLRQRGFNQAMLLAEQIAAHAGGVVVDDLLVRENRPAQRTLTAARRIVNLQGAFACIRPERVAGRRVLLVDDVATTGATVSACADTLAAAGASRISALAFARDL
jgi:ComF family protein